VRRGTTIAARTVMREKIPAILILAVKVDGVTAETVVATTENEVRADGIAEGMVDEIG
jgi:hypothetical protein